MAGPGTPVPGADDTITPERIDALSLAIDVYKRQGLCVFGIYRISKVMLPVFGMRQKAMLIKRFLTFDEHCF